MEILSKNTLNAGFKVKCFKEINKDAEIQVQTLQKNHKVTINFVLTLPKNLKQKIC